MGPDVLKIILKSYELNWSQNGEMLQQAAPWKHQVCGSTGSRTQDWWLVLTTTPVNVVHQVKILPKNCVVWYIAVLLEQWLGDTVALLFAPLELWLSPIT